MSRLFTCLLLSSGAAVIALNNAPAHAQATGAGGAQEASPTVLDNEIIVTATRRSQRLQDVPLSVSVVSSQALLERGLSEVGDLPRLVPTLTFLPAAQVNSRSLTIRGVGTYSNADSIDQSVGVNIDGVSIGRPAGSFDALVDLERVEVMQGPQGLLFGRNASAGLVAIHTAKPKFEDSLRTRFAYGSYNAIDMEGVANLELMPDTLALRVAAWHFTRDGYVTHVPAGEKLDERNDYGVRMRLRWQPDDQWEANLIGEFTGRDARCCTLTSAYYPDGSIWKQADLDVGITPQLANNSTGVLYDPKDRYHQVAATFQLDYNLDGAQITSVTGYRRNVYETNYSIVYSNVPGIDPTNEYDGKYRQFSQELRIASTGNNNLDYVAGLFYFNLKQHTLLDQGGILPATYPLPNPDAVRNNRLVDLDVHSRSYAAFTELTYHLDDALSLIGGVRLSHDRVNGSYNRTGAPGTVVIIAGPISNVASTTHTNVSGRLGVEYKLDPTKMLYATVSTGYKAPGLAYSTSLNQQTIDATGAIVDAEKVRAAEIGVKSQWFDRRLTLNVALFYERFTDFQAATIVPASEGSTAVSYGLLNAPALESKGISGDFDTRPFRGFSLSGSFAYTDATFTDFPGSQCFPGQTVAQGCVGGVQDISGTGLPGNPKWAFNLSARQEVRVSDRLNLFGQGSYKYSSRINYWLTGDPNTSSPGYGLTDIMVGANIGERWTITGYVKNLFQVSNFGRLATNSFGPGYVTFASIERERTFGISLEGQF